VREVTPTLSQIKNELHVTSRYSWEQVSSLAPAQEYPAGIELFKQEVPARDVYLIESGLIKLMAVEQNDREILVGLRSPGWIVGSASVILNKKYAFSATTLTGCRLRRVTAEAFLRLLRNDQEFAWFFQQMQSHELHEQLTQLVEFGCLSARDKLEHLLSRMISALVPKGPERKVRLKLPLKHRELAELLSITPEHLSRVLREMQQEGLVFKEKGWICIADVRMLRVAAESPL
jgi:CRP-like cAMP-binding protein